jgi:hypothetical protein
MKREIREVTAIRSRPLKRVCQSSAQTLLEQMATKAKMTPGYFMHWLRNEALPAVDDNGNEFIQPLITERNEGFIQGRVMLSFIPCRAGTASMDTSDFLTRQP